MAKRKTVWEDCDILLNVHWLYEPGQRLFFYNEINENDELHS